MNDMDDGIDDMYIHRQMDQFDDGGLRFSEKKYKEINYSDEEDCEDEDVKEDSLQQISDDRRNENDNGDNGWSQFCQSTENSGDEVSGGVGIGKKGRGGVKKGFGDSHPLEIEGEWMSKLKGKDMKTLCLEDLNGVTFGNLKEAENFYTYYAFVVGFNCRKSKRDRVYLKGEEVVNRRVWLCSKEGHAPNQKNGRVVPMSEQVVSENENSRDETREPKKKKRKCVRREIKYSRTGCLARFVVKLNFKTREFYASMFHTQHNHDLYEVSMRHILRSFRHVTLEDIVEVQALQAAGVSISGVFDYMMNQTGGSAHVAFLVKDLYNKLAAEKEKNCSASGDAESFINWMRLKGREEKEFYCRYTKDAEGRLTNVYWRDVGSLTDYNSYGDVLIIDSTYQTNVYGMPLVLFVGANNHRASVVFGCALVSILYHLKTVYMMDLQGDLQYLCLPTPFIN